MAEFETSGSVIIEVDQGSLREARRDVERSIGSVSVDVDGGGAGIADGGPGSNLGSTLETGLDLDEERNEILLDMLDEIEEGAFGRGGGGDGGGFMGFDLPSLGLGAVGGGGLLGGLAGRLGLGGGLGSIGAGLLGGGLGLSASGILESMGFFDKVEGFGADVRDWVDDTFGPEVGSMLGDALQFTPGLSIGAAIPDLGQGLNELLTGDISGAIDELEDAWDDFADVWEDRAEIVQNAGDWLEDAVPGTDTSLADLFDLDTGDGTDHMEQRGQRLAEGFGFDTGPRDSAGPGGPLGLASTAVGNFFNTGGLPSPEDVPEQISVGMGGLSITVDAREDLRAALRGEMDAVIDEIIRQLSNDPRAAEALSTQQLKALHGQM